MKQEIYKVETYQNDCCKIIEDAIVKGKCISAEILKAYWRLNPPALQKSVILDTKKFDNNIKITRGYSILRLNDEYYKIYFSQAGPGTPHYLTQIPEKIETKTFSLEAENTYSLVGNSYILTLV